MSATKEPTRRMFVPGDSDKLWIQIRAINLIPEVLDEQSSVLACATRHVEDRAAAWLRGAKQGGDLLGFGAVVLDAGVQQVVNVSRLGEHCTVSGDCCLTGRMVAVLPNVCHGDVSLWPDRSRFKHEAAAGHRALSFRDFAARGSNHVDSRTLETLSGAREV